MKLSLTEIAAVVFIGLFAVIGIYGWANKQPRATRAQIEADHQRWAVPAASPQADQPDRRQPKIACDYLNILQGLQTRGWKTYGDGPWTCLSYPVRLSPDALTNVAYYVNGSETEARELKLVLNVHYPEDTAAAQEFFTTCGSILYKNALGQAVIEEIKQAMTAGRNGRWNANFARASIELNKEKWPTGKGYTYNLLIK